jgi:N-acetylglucosamine-6-sulfatase
MQKLWNLPILAIIIIESLLFGCSQKSNTSAESGDPADPNIIFVLTDDHRFDAMGFMDHPFLETPNMDKMAEEGIHFDRALVTTSLCSPSRASILSGMYAHNHGVVNNYNPVDSTLKFFPEYLQDAGYNTAFIGKWHMGGETDDPQRGFDYWLSFKGQGTYWADGHGTSRVVPQTSMDGYNVNGNRIPQKGYITDELTDFAMKWLEDYTDKRPFMLYLSHKAVHSDFVASDRHLGRYKDVQLALPSTYHIEKGKPMWLINQRNSRHGAEFGYNLSDFDLNKYYRRYCESLLAVDENLGRIMDWVENSDEAENTIVIYMGDNGFQFGEHGLIDKRTAYEASIKVPLLIWKPGHNPKNKVISEAVANIDIAPTILDLVGISIPGNMDGQSFKPLMDGENVVWRKELLYEYYWERNYPYTPTTHALLTDRYKFIRYQGIWDLDEFYDMQKDPDETRNLINDENYQELIESHRFRMFELLRETNGNTIPLLPDKGNTFILRDPEKSEPAEFPESFYQK